jgi:hypothetical protein
MRRKRWVVRLHGRERVKGLIRAFSYGQNVRVQVDVSGQGDDNNKENKHHSVIPTEEQGRTRLSSMYGPRRIADRLRTVNQAREKDGQGAGWGRDEDVLFSWNVLASTGSENRSSGSGSMRAI